MVISVVFSILFNGLCWSAKSDSQDLAILKKAFPQAHQVFQEVWRKLRKRETILVESVFTEAMRAFVHPKECVDFKYWIEKNTIVRSRCGGGTPVKIILWSVSEMPSNSSAAGGEIFSQIALEFISAEMRKSAGLGLSTLGKVIRCKLQFSSKGGLQTFSCEGLGQDLEKPKYLVFDEFEYKQKNNIQVLAKYRIFSDLITLERTGEIQVPQTGKIQITESVQRKEVIPQGKIEFGIPLPSEVDKNRVEPVNKENEEKKPKPCDPNLSDKEICDPGVHNPYREKSAEPEESKR